MAGDPPDPIQEVIVADECGSVTRDAVRVDIAQADRHDRGLRLDRGLREVAEERQHPAPVAGRALRENRRAPAVYQASTERADDLVHRAAPAALDEDGA